MQSLNKKAEASNYMQDMVRETVAKFIRDIFNYENIDVNFTDSTVTEFDNSATALIEKDLVEENAHTSFCFLYRYTEKKVLRFSITNIPATPTSKHIRIFFKMIIYYIELVYSDLRKGYNSSTNMDAFMPHVERTRTWLYSIERIIIPQYLFQVFNLAIPNTEDVYDDVPNVRYDMDLIEKALSFGIELNTRKIENEEIYCGFIFHDFVQFVDDNSMRSVEFKNKIEFGDFSGLKNYLSSSNGQDVFFNVTDGKVTHLLVTKEKVNEIVMNPASDGKTFNSRPMILSVQGNGKILFIEGRENWNQPILEINNSKPLIRDVSFVKAMIQQELEAIAGRPLGTIEFLSKWIISLSQKKHGTSLIFINVTQELEKKLVKAQGITEQSGEFLKGISSRHDMFLLDSLTKPDGAIIFNSRLVPTHFSTILPISTDIKPREGSGGARHSSVSNFTEAFQCTGIVVSEDGPISIFKKGERIIKF